MPAKRSKRLIFCFDGTWNRLSAPCPTNVVKLAQMVKPVASDGTAQIVYYDEGIGAGKKWLGRKLDGAFGRGMLSIMRDAYCFLLFNYEAGDEIFVFGFSRGAFTARSFVGFVRHAGILDVVNATLIDKAISIYRDAPAGQTGKESALALRFRLRNCRSICVSETDYEFRRRFDPHFSPDTPLLEFRYVGVWDTVRALGVPDFLPGASWFNRKHGFHDAVLTSKIRAARHAVALDERRLTFLPTLFGRRKVVELNALAETKHGGAFEEWAWPYQEKWFPGVHGAVGGGGARRGLSDGALQWVLDGALRAGLDIRNDLTAVAFDIKPDPLDQLYNEGPGLWAKIQKAFHGLFRISRRGPAHEDEIGFRTYQRWAATHDGKAQPYAPRSLARVGRILDRWPYRNPPQFTSASAVLEEYEIGSADTLSKLARDRLGDPRLWTYLFELNRDRIDDPDYLANGLKIRVPRPDESQAEAISSPFDRT